MHCPDMFLTIHLTEVQSFPAEIPMKLTILVKDHLIASTTVELAAVGTMQSNRPNFVVGNIDRLYVR